MMMMKSTKRTMRSYLRSYLLFCEHFAFHPFPVTKAFFSFLRISNLVPRTLADIGSPGALHLTPLRVRFSAQGACLSITRTKTIQFKQRVLEIPIPCIPRSPLCPVAALREHLARNRPPPHMPLFVVTRHGNHTPILAHQYNAFIKAAISAIGVDPARYSSRSFRRGGASFAFNQQAPTEFIKAQGDWRSDAYLVYLNISESNKFKILNSITARLTPSSPPSS